MSNQNKRLSSLFSCLTLSSSGPGSDEWIKPPVPQLLQCNDPPSQAERIEIETTIICAKERKNQLTEELKSANSGLQVIRIKDTIKAIDLFINSHQSILSPLRGLPQDLLSLIFIISLEPVQTRPWIRTHWYDLPSFPISQVCQWWRTVALNTPRLWCMLGDIRLNHKTDSRIGYSYTKFIDTLLTRSRGLDLWIYVYGPGQVFKTHQVIKPLVRHAQRWRVVSFETTPITVNAFRGVKHHLLRLRCLSLNWWQGTGGGNGVNIDCFSSAPVLTDFSSIGTCASCIIPWRQLKAFSEACTYDGSALGHIFTHSHGELEVLSVNPLTRTTWSSLPVTFAKLKTFHLTLRTHTNELEVNSLFRRLTLPFLEDFRVQGLYNFVLDDLLEVFRRSFQSLQHPPLKRLKIGFHEYSWYSPPAFDNCMVAMLRLIPYLQHLEIELTVLLHLFDALLATNGEEPIIPKLESLVVHWDRFSDSDDWEDKFGTIKRNCDALTKARCKVIKQRDDSNTSKANDGQSLLRFKFEFDYRPQAVFVQKYLNQWVTVPAVRRLEYLNYPSGKSPAELPDYTIWNDEVKRTLLDGLPWPGGCLDKLLADIQSTELQDVGQLYGSSLHFSIHELICCTKQSAPQTYYDEIRARATTIIDNWNGAIQADIANETSAWSKNWVLKQSVNGNTYLEYIANYDAIRASPQALGLIWGFGPDPEA